MGNESDLGELTGKVIAAAIIFLLVVLLSVLFLHLYSKWYWYHTQYILSGDRGLRRRLDFEGEHQGFDVFTVHSLDPSILKSIPVILFNAKDYRDGLQCAVCLCEISQGEKIRTLSKCSHGFHVECIDMWFHSHSTCPLCRSPVVDQSCTSMQVSLDSLRETTTPSDISNFNAESRHVHSEIAPPSSLSLEIDNHEQDRMLMIDLPTRSDEQEQKAAISYTIRSLKTVLSRDRQGSPRGTDVEQVVCQINDGVP